MQRKINDKMFKMTRDIHYYDNFIYNPMFPEKRFERYTAKMLDIFNDFIKQQSEIITSLDEYVKANLTSIYKLIFEGVNSEAIFDKFVMLNYYNLSELQYSYYDTEKADIIDFINGSTKKEYNWGQKKVDIDSIFKSEFKIACRRWISSKSFEIGLETTTLFEQCITETNYFTTLPDPNQNAVEMYEFIRILIRLIKSDIDKLFEASKSNRQNYDIAQDIVLTSMNTAMLEYDMKIGDLEDVINQKNQQIKNLQEAKEQLLKTKDENINLILENEAELLKQNKKVLLNYEKLQKKYIELLKSVSDDYNTSNSENENIISSKEVDINAKYAFVIFADTPVKQKILSSFPNATFIHSGQNINVNNTDYVIALTLLCKHPDYFKAKDICKRNNIPFIHCNYITIDMIKETIWNYINSHNNNI